MKRSTSVLTVCGAVLLAAVTLQPNPFSRADDNRLPMLDEPAHLAQPVGPEVIEQWLAVAAEINPEKAERLRALCDSDQQEFERIMRNTGRRIIGLAELKQQDPGLYEIKVKELRTESQVESAAQRLAEAVRSGREDEIPALEAELRKWVRMQVLVSIRARGDYLLRLREHMQRLEEELEEEARNFDRIVEDRFQAMIQRARGIVQRDE